jgi:hypothetical protein
MNELLAGEMGIVARKMVSVEDRMGTLAEAMRARCSLIDAIKGYGDAERSQNDDLALKAIAAVTRCLGTFESAVLAEERASVDAR